MHIYSTYVHCTLSVCTYMYISRTCKECLGIHACTFYVYKLHILGIYMHVRVMYVVGIYMHVHTVRTCPAHSWSILHVHATNVYSTSSEYTPCTYHECALHILRIYLTYIPRMYIAYL